MRKFSKSQNINYLAIELLDRLGNSNPTQKQIGLVESILVNVSLDQKLSFDYQLTKEQINCLLHEAKNRYLSEK